MRCLTFLLTQMGLKMTWNHHVQLELSHASSLPRNTNSFAIAWILSLLYNAVSRTNSVQQASNFSQPPSTQLHLLTNLLPLRRPLVVGCPNSLLIHPMAGSLPFTTIFAVCIGEWSPRIASDPYEGGSWPWPGRRNCYNTCFGPRRYQVALGRRHRSGGVDQTESQIGGWTWVVSYLKFYCVHWTNYFE